MWTWLSANPGNYGEPEMFPTLTEWLEEYVPKFTDAIALIIGDELVAVGLLDEEAFIHCLVNPVCERPYLRAKLMRQVFRKHFVPRYKFLYTELTRSNQKAEKMVRFLGFAVLPQSFTHPNRKVAIYRKRK